MTPSVFIDAGGRSSSGNYRAAWLCDSNDQCVSVFFSIVVRTCRHTIMILCCVVESWAFARLSACWLAVTAAALSPAAQFNRLDVMKTCMHAGESWYGENYVKHPQYYPLSLHLTVLHYENLTFMQFSCTLKKPAAGLKPRSIGKLFSVLHVEFYK
jgi:hypothetical protein